MKRNRNSLITAEEKNKKESPEPTQSSVAWRTFNAFYIILWVGGWKNKMHQIKALSNINHYFTSHRSKIRHLIVITKSEEILEIFWEI